MDGIFPNKPPHAVNLLESRKVGCSSVASKCHAENAGILRLEKVADSPTQISSQFKRIE